MKKIAAACLLLLAFAFADFKQKSAEDFIYASEQCFTKLKLPHSYEPRFKNFDYPDEPIVHRYLRCIWVDLELWNDKIGFNIEHLANVYKNSANTEVLIPILSTCNRNPHSDPPLKWVYRAFKCILDSPVGPWFKNVVRKKNNS